MSTATMTDFIPDGAVLNLRDNYSSPPYLLSDFQTGKSIIRVAVNGADVSRHCFAFDAAAGYAEVYKVDVNGHFVLCSKDGTREILTAKVYGKVDVSVQFVDPYSPKFDDSQGTFD